MGKASSAEAPGRTTGNWRLAAKGLGKFLRAAVGWGICLFKRTDLVGVTW
jgi:hypothetical protein